MATLSWPNLPFQLEDISNDPQLSLGIATAVVAAVSLSSWMLLLQQREAKVSAAGDKKDTSMLWMVHGVAYDLTDFIPRHPGGREALLLGRGRDCTAMVESYHPFSQDSVQTILSKYRVSSSKAKPYQRDFFYDVLSKRVEAVLRSKGLDPVQDRAASPQRVAYYLTIMTAVLVSAYYYAKGSMLASLSLGVFGWLWGALGHDAGHFAASRNAVVNEWGVWAMTLLCNPVQWQHQHTYAHHSYTNEFDHDPDLHHFQDVLLRVHKRFQPIYANRLQLNTWFVLLAYCFVVVGTCVTIPLTMILQGSLHGIVEWTDRKRPVRALAFLAHWIGYVGFIMVWPFYVIKSWPTALITVVLHLVTSGLLFALFSQINHLNEASLEKDTSTKRDPRLENSWAVAQIETSNNFSVNSTAWHIWSNGLNLQIEHHLFPGLNHEHLHLIVPVVQATCLEFGVNYKTYNGWSDIFRATLDWLRQLAKEADTNEEPKEDSKDTEEESEDEPATGISPSSSTSSLRTAEDVAEDDKNKTAVPSVIVPKQQAVGAK